MRKKLLSCILAVVMCLVMVPSAFAIEPTQKLDVLDRFEDVPDGAWYLRYLETASGSGVVYGTSATTFSPDEPVTRAQFVTLLGRAVGACPEVLNLGYADVDLDSWYASYVGWASTRGYMEGYSADTYAPDQTISIEEMACALDNYLTKEDIEITEYRPVLICEDYCMVSDSAKASVQNLLWYGCLFVDKDDNLYPQRTATRADAVASIMSMIELIESQASIAQYDV